MYTLLRFLFLICAYDMMLSSGLRWIWVSVSTTQHERDRTITVNGRTVLLLAFQRRPSQLLYQRACGQVKVHSFLQIPPRSYDADDIYRFLSSNLSSWFLSNYLLLVWIFSRVTSSANGRRNILMLSHCRLCFRWWVREVIVTCSSNTLQLWQNNSPSLLPVLFGTSAETSVDEWRSS